MTIVTTRISFFVHLRPTQSKNYRNQHVAGPIIKTQSSPENENSDFSDIREIQIYVTYRYSDNSLRSVLSNINFALIDFDIEMVLTVTRRLLHDTIRRTCDRIQLYE